MVVDSSALLAVILQEAESARVVATMRATPKLRVSAATLLEASIVMTRRRGVAGVMEVDALVADVGIAPEAVTIRQAHLARDAYVRFGKGRHPAALNFGDCFGYALAKHVDEPLLFVGGDFARTDVRVA